jgi:hypothetical protein
MNIEKLSWIVKIFKKLMDENFEGTLLIDFHKGQPSKRYRRQTVETAE